MVWAPVLRQGSDPAHLPGAPRPVSLGQKSEKTVLQASYLHSCSNGRSLLYSLDYLYVWTFTNFKFIFQYFFVVWSFIILSLSVLTYLLLSFTLMQMTFLKYIDIALNPHQMLSYLLSRDAPKWKFLAKTEYWNSWPKAETECGFCCFSFILL